MVFEVSLQEAWPADSHKLAASSIADLPTGLAIYSLPAGPIEVKKCNRIFEWTIAIGIMAQQGLRHVY